MPHRQGRFRMKFYEYKAHEILRKYGIPVPRGVLVSSASDLRDPPLPCAVKAQVLVGGRGKAGGIRFARTLEESRDAARSILGMTIGPYTVRQVYAQEMLDIAQELYLSITIDRSARAPLLMASTLGGVDIESVPEDRSPLEQGAQDKGIKFIQPDGEIGVIAKGAGLTMATLDVLNLKGGRGGTFLDLGGTDDPEKVKQAFEILLRAKPSVILLNIFGGITKADTVAVGVKEALEEMHVNVPVVARIKGVNEDRAREILRGIGHPADTVEEAAEIAVKASTGGA